MESSSNIILSCSDAILCLLHTFKNSMDLSIFDINLRERLAHDIKTLEINLAANNITKREIYYTSYALIALVDETILYSIWNYKEQWRENTLQMIFFAEHLAGEKFFDQLQELRLNPQENINLLELYYICMQFGFQGRYRIGNGSGLPGVTKSSRGAELPFSSLPKGNVEWVKERSDGYTATLSADFRGNGEQIDKKRRFLDLQYSLLSQMHQIKPDQSNKLVPYSIEIIPQSVQEGKPLSIWIWVWIGVGMLLSILLIFNIAMNTDWKSSAAIRVALSGNP